LTPRDKRLLALVDWLRVREHSTVPEVMEAFGISHRTAFRDFEALVAASIPIRSDRNVGYRLAPGYYIPPFRLTADEIGALAAGARILASRDDVVAQVAAAALAKIRALLSPSEPSGVRGGSEDHSAPRDIQGVEVELLKEAAHDRQLLALDYEAIDGTISNFSVRQGPARHRGLPSAGGDRRAW